MRSILLLLLSALALVCVALPVALGTDVCLPGDEASLRVGFFLQASGRFINDPERRQQYAFANSIIAGLNALNNNNNYPGFSSAFSSQYKLNSASIHSYSNGDNSPSGISPNDLNSDVITGAAGDWQSSLYAYNYGTPNLRRVFRRIRNAGFNEPQVSPPVTTGIRVAVIINDGLAWGRDGDVDLEEQSDINRVNNHYEAIRCILKELKEQDYRVIWIHSNRAMAPGQKPIPSLASEPALDFEFDDFSELMQEHMLHQVAAALRKIASPRSSSASSCVVSGAGHITTFDGLHYDYSGSGDYWLFRSLRATDSLSVQYRAGPCASAASCVLGAVITEGTRSVEVVIADRTGNFRNAYIAHDGARLPLADFVSFTGVANEQHPLFNLTVKMLGTESYQVTVRFATGQVLTIQEHLLVLHAAPHFFGRSAGLCGNWNGCSLDDLLDSCGKVGAVNTSDPTASSRFGDSWTVAAGESLFSTPPPQGIAAWEVSNNVVCTWSPIDFVRSPSYDRWPYLPGTIRDSALFSSIDSISTFPKASVDEPNAAHNNLGLITLRAPKVFTAFKIPSECTRLRGALLQDCVMDAETSTGSVVGSTELLWHACAQYCRTGRLFTNLVASADCIAAQICARGAEMPDLHRDYSTAGVLPAVSFGNPNVPHTFFQPTLGLSGRYLLQVAEADLCGVSKKIQAVDIQCAIETPEVVLSFPGLTSAAEEGEERTSEDPLVAAITSIVPDVNAGYPLVTINAGVFPQSALLGQSWKIIARPTVNAANVSIPAPQLEGQNAGRVRFMPNHPGTYVLEFAVWTGCSVSRARALIYAACSTAAPVASIQPVIEESYTNGAEVYERPIYYTDSNNVGFSWVGPDRNTAKNGESVHGSGDATLYDRTTVRDDSMRNRWTTVSLNAQTTFDVDSPAKSLRYEWTLKDTSSLFSAASGIVLVDYKEEHDQNFISSNSAPNSDNQCSSTGEYTPAKSMISVFAQSIRPHRFERFVKRTYSFGRLPPADLAAPRSTQIIHPESISNYGPYYSRLNNRQLFGASSSKPSGAVAPFTNLFNGAFRREFYENIEYSLTNITNSTAAQAEVLCRVTLESSISSDYGATVEVSLSDEGDLPKEFDDARRNWCAEIASAYQIQLSVADECQTSTDVITLEPTCDGYTEAVLTCKQTVYWNNAQQQFDSVYVEGLSSFDQMYDSPTGQNQYSGASRAGEPYGRQLIYKWDVESPTAVPNLAASGITHAVGQTQFSDDIFTTAQTFTVDVPGVYTVGLTVSNRCAVSERATTSVHFSCYGANPCDAKITQKVQATVGSETPVEFATSSTTNLITEPAVENGAFRPIVFDSNTLGTALPGDDISVGVPAHTPQPMHRWNVVTAPAGSKFADTKSLTHPKLTGWDSWTNDLTFVPDVAGEYRVEIQLTDSCGCDIRSIQVGITARCSTTGASATRLSIYIDNQNPSEYATNPVTVGSSLTISSMTPSSIYSWTLSGPGLPAETFTMPSFIFRPEQSGIFTLAVSANDGCQQITNSTQFEILPEVIVGTIPPPDCTISSKAVANAVVIDAAGVRQDSATEGSAVTVQFRNQALPKVTLAGFGGFENGDSDYAMTDVEWTVVQAPEDSIYRVANVSSMGNWQEGNEQEDVDFHDFSYNALTNTNRYTIRRTVDRVRTQSTYVTDVVLPIEDLNQYPTGDISNPFGRDWEQGVFQPEKYETPTKKAYSELHSQVCITLDRPGVYRFKLSYKNNTDLTRCPTSDEVYFIARCSDNRPTVSVTTTPAVPRIDSLKPLRIALTAVGADLDAGDADRLSYSWRFIQAPALSQPFNTPQRDRKYARNYTATGVEILQPYYDEPTNFPALFNPHTKNPHFLALAPGNYTLLASVSDGCHHVQQPVIVIVGCDGRNSYGSLTDPIVSAEPDAAAAVSVGPSNTNAFTITDATNGAVAITSGSGVSSDVTRPLFTQWSIVGFEPSFAANEKLQESREARGLSASSFEKVVSGSRGAEVDNSEGGLSRSSKLGLAIALPLIFGILVIAVIAWFILKKKAGQGSPKVHDEPKPVELATGDSN